MKLKVNVVLSFLIFVFPLMALAEDIIVLNGGDIVKSKVIEINQTEVKYKKISNPKGPTYTINKSDILSITFDNGEIEKFGNAVGDKQDKDNVQDNKNTQLLPDAANDELINQYNCQYPIHPGKTRKDKIVEDGIIYWGFADGSILSTDDIEVRFRRKGGYQEKLFYLFDFENNNYVISVYNKTKQVIYIDLANTFRVVHYNGTDEGSTWYDPTIIGTNESSDRGATLGLGAVSSALGIGGVVGTLASGIGIGGGKSRSTSVTTQMERILAVPPMSEVELPPHKHVEGKDIISSYEDLGILGNLKEKLAIKKYELKPFTYEDTLFKRDYYITFSKSPSFDTYSTIPIYAYVRAIYGYHTFVEMSVKDFNIENPSKLLVEHIKMWK